MSNIKRFSSRKEVTEFLKEKGIDTSNWSEEKWLSINKGQGEIHIMKIAEMIYDELQESTPVLKKAGEWHIPYFNNYNFLGPSSDAHLVEDLVKVATSMAARESYTTVDGAKEVTFEEHLKLYDKLVAYEPPHCFTEGTEILTSDGWLDFKYLTKEHKIAAVNLRGLRFNGFEYPTNIINEDYTGNIYNLPDGFGITPNHKLLGNLVRKTTDRKKSYDEAEVIYPETEFNGKFDIFREMRMFSACNPNFGVDSSSILYLTGILYGFFLGDGHCKHKKVYFHLKKKRKILFLENLLLKMDIDYSITEYKDGTVNFIVDVKEDFTVFYDENKNKILPKDKIDYSNEFLKGLFLGLQQSDGSIKRKTWVYDTYSESLCKTILELCPLVGLTGVLYDTYEHYRIGFKTNNNILLNDSRKPVYKVTTSEYNGKVYCVNIPSKGIIVRKNGNVMITHNSSPMEHCGKAMSELENSLFTKTYVKEDEDTGVMMKVTEEGWCRNFRGFIPLRHLIETKIK